MALGQVIVLPASGSREIPLSGTGGGVLYPSLSVLNPNDGVLYVARNRACTSSAYGDWDWKVPSQSYALLPGYGGFSSVGLFYLDQSGAGHQGEFSLYSSNQQIDIPLFSSVGRALQAQTTALDITEGTLPANPGAGILRIWADGTDSLHGLNGAGVDEKLIGTRDALGSVLAGFLPNPTWPVAGITVPNGSIEATAGIVAAGPKNSSSVAGDLNTRRPATDTGAVFFGSSGHYLYYDGAGWQFSPPLSGAYLVDASVTQAKIAAGAVSQVIVDQYCASDIWANSALSAGDNYAGIGDFAATVPESVDQMLFVLEASARIVGTSANSGFGWQLYVDGALYRRFSRYYIPTTTPNSFVNGGVVFQPASLSGSHNFGIRFYSSAAETQGAYLRCSSVPNEEYLHFTVIVLRR